jgi:hypothetical protein
MIGRLVVLINVCAGIVLVPVVATLVIPVDIVASHLKVVPEILLKVTNAEVSPEHIV